MGFTGPSKSYVAVLKANSWTDGKLTFEKYPSLYAIIANAMREKSENVSSPGMNILTIKGRLLSDSFSQRLLFPI